MSVIEGFHCKCCKGLGTRLMLECFSQTLFFRNVLVWRAEVWYKFHQSSENVFFMGGNSVKRCCYKSHDLQIKCKTTQHYTQSWVTWSHENHLNPTDWSHVRVRWQSGSCHMTVMWQPDTCHVTVMWQPDSASLVPRPHPKSGNRPGVTCKNSRMCCVSSLRLE